MTPTLAAARRISFGNDDLNDDLMTEERKIKLCPNDELQTEQQKMKRKKMNSLHDDVEEDTHTPFTCF